MGGERRHSARDEEDEPQRLTFQFEIAEDSLELCVSGEEKPTVSAEERELCLALIKATVDSYEYDDGTMRLTKRLQYEAQ
jgi:hypothetical protein